jgi:hypothetical protein
MQKILFLAMSFIIISCHSEEKNEAEAKTTPTQTVAAVPYTATYSSQFELGDSKNAETILNIWKSWDDGTISSSRKFFADTAHFYFRDGSKLEGNMDSVMANIQRFRNSLASVKNTVHMYMTLKSKDKNENWVFIWATEVITDRQGKTDSAGLQESWRFNRDGKVDLLYQFGKNLVAPPMAK